MLRPCFFLMTPAFLCALVAWPPARAQETARSPFSFKAGIGYEFLSQEFFLETVADTSTDPLLDQVTLETTYLDDAKGLFSVVYSPFVDDRVRLETRYEQTPELIRGRFLTDLRLPVGGNRLTVLSELDLRERYDGTGQSGDSYRYGRIDGKLVVPLNDNDALRFRLNADGVDFDSTGPFTYGYYRIGARAGYERSFENFSFVDFDLFVTGRKVDDSGSLDYLSFGVDGHFFGFIGDIELDSYHRIERRNFNFPTDRDDFTRIESELRSRLPLVRDYFLRPELDAEWVNFSDLDPINFDYYRLESRLLIGLDQDPVTIALGPLVERQSESEGDLFFSEDYLEYAARIEVDYFSLGGLFASIESDLGFRDIDSPNQFQSDFYFERLSLIGDLQIAAGLSFNILFSAEWEWHDISSEDSRVFLLNTGLNYSF